MVEGQAAEDFTVVKYFPEKELVKRWLDVGVIKEVSALAATTGLYADCGRAGTGHP